MTNVSTLPRQTRREFKLSHDGGTSKACPPRTKKFARQPIMCLAPRKATSWLSCCQLPVLAAEVSVDIPWSNVPYNPVPVSVCRSLFACFHKTTAATIEKHRKISALPQWPKMPLRLRRSIPITGRSFNAENRSWCTAAVPRQTNVQLRLEISWVSSHLKESQAFQDKNATFIWCTGPYMAYILNIVRTE